MDSNRGEQMSNQVTCPHCDQVFEMDAAGYADILKQIRGAEFQTEIHQRMQSEQEKHLLAIQVAEAKIEKESAEKSINKDKQIERLKNELESADVKTKLAVQEAKYPLEKEITTLEHKVESVENEKTTIKQSLDAKYTAQLKEREDAIERLKDLKAKMSVKMVGETLELHCQNEFNTLRAAAFPNAYFGKDNDGSGGTKGDYIFRDKDANGTEFISIMFEMKDELEETKSKQKNQKFFKKLDKDRNEKNCEYAILVSSLESDNDFYNNGIVDMSHEYPKMYVIRPQFFIPMITLLRNAAMKSLQVRNELELVKEQNIDITTFEDDLANVQAGFTKNYDTAKKQFEEAIKSIDASISDLNKVKDRLLRSGNNYRLANDKIQGISIKKLTRKNPTMKAKFADVKKKEEEE